MRRFLLCVCVGTLAWADPPLPRTLPAGVAPAVPSMSANVANVTMVDVVRRAITSNVDVEIAQADLQSRRAQVTVAREPFALKLDGDLFYRGAFDPALGSYSIYYPDPVVRSQKAAATLGLSTQLDFGTRLTVKSGFSLLSTDVPGTTINPTYQLPVEFEASQPLLRGIGNASARDFRIAKVRNEQGDFEFQRVRNATVFSAASAYVNLQAAEALVTSREKTLALAKSMATLTQDLISSGRLAPTVAYTQLTLVSQRQQDLDAAVQSRDRTRSALNEVLGTPFMIYAPTESLSSRGTEWTEQEAAGLAELNNPEVKAQQAELRVRDIDLDVRLNQALPDLRLRLAAGVTGTAGISQCVNGYNRDGIFQCAVPSVLAGSVDQAASNLAALRYGYVEGRLTLQVPLDNSPAIEAIEVARLARMQAERRLRQLRDVSKDKAAQSVRAVRRFEKTLADVRAAVSNAERALESGRSGFALGKLTQTELIRLEEFLAQARDREVATAQSMAVERLYLLAVTGSIVPELLGDSAP